MSSTAKREKSFHESNSVMYKRLFILHLYLSCILFPLYSQYEGGLALNDGVYKGYKVVNEHPEAMITQIEQISLGNGIQVYRDADKHTYLDGAYYVLLGGGGRLHGIAKFSKGLLHGEYLVYSDGNLWRKIIYNRGLLEGKRYEYYNNGLERSVTDYKKSIAQHTIRYHSNGQVQETISFNEFGLKHGSVITYDENGRVIGESNYEHGSLNGKSMSLLHGDLQEIKHYNHSTLEGEYLLIYKSGQIKAQGSYDSRSERTGEWKEYNENGSLKSIVHYDKGLQNGTSTIYFDNGKIKSLGEYKQGKEHGKFQEYEESLHRLVSETTYKDGILDGEYKAYDKGVLWRDCIYKEGKMVSEKQYLNGKIHILKMLDESGNLVDVRKYDTTGQSVYQNQKYRKHDAVRLVEDESGIIDVVY